MATFVDPVTRGSRWRPLLGWVLVLAAAIFLGLTIARHWRQVEAFHWDVRWGLLAASVVALTGVLTWGVLVWKLVLDRFDHPPVPMRRLLRIWYLSNLARYVPGKIWQFVGAAELARLAGLSRSLVLTSMVVHMGFGLLSAAVMASMVLLPGGLPEGVPSVGLGALAALSLGLVHPALIDQALSLLSRILKRDVVRWRGRWRDGVFLLGLSLVSWVLYGAAFALFIHAVVGTSLEHVLPLAGVNALSFLAGYLVFLAPAGLGAREGVMAVLLRPFAPVAIAAVLAVLARLWTVGAELMGAGIVLAVTRGDGLAVPRDPPPPGATGDTL
jgi:glycosyltransferase 2 family protein